MLAVSRSLAIWALRFGFRGRGAGGVLVGFSRARRERWRLLRFSSSAVMVGVEEDADIEMALVVGSRWRGCWKKVSSSSFETAIVRGVYVLVAVFKSGGLSLREIDNSGGDG